MAKNLYDTVSTAQEYFDRRRGNCAQAILYAFRQHFPVTDGDIAHARKRGHGKAEKGHCGALWAVLLLAGDDAREQVRTSFEAKAGSSSCRDIRRSRRATCGECVVIAAETLAELMVGKAGRDNGA